MTELQKCEYELLKKVLHIINDSNLKSFLVCGSALGAVKYSGFIPWDDDIDIALPRQDYEKLIQIMNELCDEDIEIQNYRFDSKVPFFYSKIRNKNTTFIERTVMDIDMNHGVFIDVFPLDGYPKGKTSAFFFEIKKRILWRIISLIFIRKSKWINLILFPIKIIVEKNINILVRIYESMISKFDISDSNMMCNYGNSPLKSEYSLKCHYGKGVKMLFEGMEVYVPEDYDAYLTQKYGDWRNDLPENQQIGHHYYSICDLKRPYTDYIEKLSNGRIRVKTKI